jgi:hypothetical protein
MQYTSQLNFHVHSGTSDILLANRYSVASIYSSIATKGPHDYVQRLDQLRNVCYKHINLRIVFGVMFTELILVYYLIEN